MAELPRARRYDRSVSLAVLGDSGCGKTSLSYHFANGLFIQHAETIGVEFHVRTLLRNQKLVRACIWDTCGMERYRSVAPVYFRGVHGCVFVFDCTQRDTFHGVREWWEELMKTTKTAVPCVLLCNKIDAKKERQVSGDEGAALARQLGMPFFETSALDGSNVYTAFIKLIDDVLGSDCDVQDGEAFKLASVAPARSRCPSCGGFLW